MKDLQAHPIEGNSSARTDFEAPENDNASEKPHRAARYRALALTEKDQARANLLDRLAAEAEHGMLCTAKHLRLVYDIKTETDEQPTLHRAS